jgi:hypothetical protein
MPRFAPERHGERWLAIRAARFVCKADFPGGQGVESPPPYAARLPAKGSGLYNGLGNHCKGLQDLNILGDNQFDLSSDLKSVH